MVTEANKEANKGTFGFLREIEEALNRGFGDFKGTLILKGILDRHGSQELYIPKTTERYRQLRDMQIKTAFNGRNHAALALRWDICEKTVRNIIDN